MYATKRAFQSWCSQSQLLKSLDRFHMQGSENETWRVHCEDPQNALLPTMLSGPLGGTFPACGFSASSLVTTADFKSNAHQTFSFLSRLSTYLHGLSLPILNNITPLSVF
jgi:hypothetical protein